MMYKEIWKVNVSEYDSVDENEYKQYNQYFLMTDETVDELDRGDEKPYTFDGGYNIALEGLFYNTSYDINEIIERYPVNSLEDVLDFCRKNNLYADSMIDCCYTEKDTKEEKSVVGIHVGGEKYDILTENLELIKVDPYGFVA